MKIQFLLFNCNGGNSNFFSVFLIKTNEEIFVTKNVFFFNLQKHEDSFYNSSNYTITQTNLRPITIKPK